MPDIRDVLLIAVEKGIEQMFELTTEEIILIVLAVVLAIISLILLIRWVD